MGNTKLIRIRRNHLRLVASTSLDFGVLAAVAPGAFSACAVVGTKAVCSATTTVDTQFYPVVNPSNARFYDFNSPVSAEISVNDFELVDGFGLALRNSGIGGVLFANDGTIQVNAGNTPKAGSADGAVFLGSSVVGSQAAIFENGIGSRIVKNSGGSGLAVVNNGTVSVLSNGSITAMSGSGIFAESNSANAADMLTVTSNEEIRISSTGIFAQRDNGDGTLTINSGGTIGSSGALGTLNSGIIAVSRTAADIAVNVSADIGSEVDRAEFVGIDAINNFGAGNSDNRCSVPSFDGLGLG